MKQTAIQQAIIMVRQRIESQNYTIMGKHTAHHPQQVERGLWDLLKDEKEQMIQVNKKRILLDYEFEQYYKDTYGEDE